MRREGGRHSCVTGTKLYGNMTVKNLTSDRCLRSWSGEWGSVHERKPLPKTVKHTQDMRFDPDESSYDPDDWWSWARHQHSIMNDWTASAVFGKFKGPRGVRAKIVQRSHKEARQQLRASVGSIVGKI